MAGGPKKTKRQRNKPCKPRGVPSKGLRRDGKHPLTPLERVLLGKGQYVTFKPVGSVRHP